MASLNNEKGPRITVTDGALIPEKGDKGFFNTWRMTLFGALTVMALLLIIKPEPYWEIFKFAIFPKIIREGGEYVGFQPSGLMITFQVTILAILAATFIGLFAGLGQISRLKWVNKICTIYVELIRGIPLLVQLFYIYFALGKFFHLQGMTAAVIAMAICYGAYMGEIFRAGIQSIPQGQMEASIALGMSRNQAIRYVILPQTMKVVLPAIGNEFIALLKDSSLVSVLAIADILRRGREFASKTFLYFESYTIIALVYLILTLLLSRLVGMMEERMDVDG
ncbi:MAG: amino acid ABC transporter permease [Spirochaetales bacterium]|nr:amino acid ABC transporter permease [Spirochaetales bacterium]